ncbi:hypothetical protein [Marinobacter sp. C2H3]|uniref:hypothetical protein n=1 Tax=Marinobacter sp. C2H3 TaxID=3119003 RepID=UPI00300F1167
MVTQAGIWMDYSKAVVVLLHGDEVDLTVIESNARAPSKSSGGHRQSAPNAHQDVVAEDHREHRYNQALGQYFERIHRRVHRASELVLLGSGQAKKEFQHYLRDQMPDLRVRECKAAGPMTSAELTRHVCRVFEHAYG